MYSGTTLTRFSGRVMGTHQKLDRLAYKQLQKLGVQTSDFPTIRRILHYEGMNGPDGIKRKSPAQDEPWHFMNPFDNEDTQLLEIVQDHYNKLVEHLREKNTERAAFEAAWLAHAIVDGLTPAHHFPYEEKLNELRGEGIETRNSYKGKLILPGKTNREKVRKNWKMWGSKGLLTAHIMFEAGVASLMKPLTFQEALPTKSDIVKIKKIGITKWFHHTAKEIAVLDMYHHYIDRGWTPKLAWQVRHKLGPAMVQTITLAWLHAVHDAGKP